MNREPLDFSLAFGSAVHDVKNSVGLLLSSLDELMAANPPKTEEESQRAVVLNYEASRINNDMMQLLSIYKLENDKLLMSIESNMVHEFLEDELLAHESLFTMKKVNVEIDCAEELSWYFDNMMLRSVINNVFVNTIRYTDDQILVKASVEEGYLCLAIEDNGKGYPPALCEDPGGYITRINFNTGSSGLGLYFSARVAELHRNKDRIGHIEVANGSSLGGGVFKIFLP